jgi:hypothetical protein
MSSSPSTPLIDERSTRSSSFDSIPDVEFLQKMLEQDLNDANQQLVTDFKRKEKNGELIPEPLLMEDKSRFVLFPIKHNDVSFDKRKQIQILVSNLNFVVAKFRSGKCTKRQKLLFGLQKRLI